MLSKISLFAFAEKWEDAIKRAGGISDNGAAQMLFSHGLLIGILCIYGWFGLRRAFGSAQ